MQQLISEIGSLFLGHVFFYFIRYFRHVGDSTCGSYGSLIRALQSANRYTLTSKDETVGIPNNLVASFVTLLSSYEKSKSASSAFFLRYNFSISYLCDANRIFISPIIEKSMTDASISVIVTFRSLSLNVN